MTAWEYLSRTTYWVETGRADDYLQSIQYAHAWKPDLDAEQPHAWPSDSGLDSLGAAGWELVGITPSVVTLQTGHDRQRGPSYGTFTVYTVIFKRPLDA